VDLFRGLAASQSVTKLFGPDAAAAKAVIGRLMPLVRDLRTGTILPVPEMTKALDA